MANYSHIPPPPTSHEMHWPPRCLKTLANALPTLVYSILLVRTTNTLVLLKLHSLNIWPTLIALQKLGGNHTSHMTFDATWQVTKVTLINMAHQLLV